MPQARRKTPFSGKAKKQQLQSKKQNKVLLMPSMYYHIFVLNFYKVELATTAEVTGLFEGSKCSSSS